MTNSLKTILARLNVPAILQKIVEASSPLVWSSYSNLNYTRYKTKAGVYYGVLEPDVGGRYNFYIIPPQFEKTFKKYLAGNSTIHLKNPVHNLQLVGNPEHVKSTAGKYLTDYLAVFL